MDRAVLLAKGKALALVAALPQRGGVVPAEEFGNLLGTFAVTVAEGDPEQGNILAVGVGIGKDSIEP